MFLNVSSQARSRDNKRFLNSFDSVKATQKNEKHEKIFYAQKKHPQRASMAGVEGVEPSSGVLETLILPMNYTPRHINNYT